MFHHRILSAAFAATIGFTAANTRAEEPAKEPAQESVPAEAAPEPAAEEAPSYVKYQGTIVSTDAAAKTVTVKTDDGLEVVLDVTAETKFRGDDPALDLSMLKSGEAVRGMYLDVVGKKQAISIRTGSKLAPPKKEKPEANAAGGMEE